MRTYLHLCLKVSFLFVQFDFIFLSSFLCVIYISDYWTCMHVCVYTFIYTYVFVHIYIYMKCIYMCTSMYIYTGAGETRLSEACQDFHR